jgi:acetyl-CoA carboxylase biotin carboxylase subunit
VYAGWTVPLDYDPLLAKLAAWAESRDVVMGRLDRALAEYAVGGIRTNTAWFREILADPEFRAGRLSTEFLSAMAARRRPSGPDLEREAVAAIAAACRQPAPAPPPAEAPSRWLAAGRETLLR